MLVILSPAKKQNINSSLAYKPKSLPKYQDEIALLVSKLRNKSEKDIKDLMKISEDLAMLNKNRFTDFDISFKDESKLSAAIMAFQGDVYQALDANSLSGDEMEFCNQHFMIISGLYGILKPLDAIQAYRLEMKTPLAAEHGKDLYAFWGEKLSNHLNQELSSWPNGVIINLASKEYSKAIRHLKSNIIDIDFKEHKNGKYQTIGIHAKKARGLMARFIIKNSITKANEIKKFNTDSYSYSEDMSNSKLFTFIR